jgi:hypothetical protein
MIIKRELKYVIITLLAVVFTFLLHEFSHWTTGEILGYKMGMTLNKAYPLSGFFTENWHYTLISSVGPIFTLIQSICAFVFIRKNHNKVLFPFLLSSFYLEFLSGIMNFRHANDLGRISETFGLGLFTIPVIFVLIHSLLVYKTIMREKYSLKFTFGTFFLILLFSSIWILLNNKFHIAII